MKMFLYWKLDIHCNESKFFAWFFSEDNLGKALEGEEGEFEPKHWRSVVYQVALKLNAGKLMNSITEENLRKTLTSYISADKVGFAKKKDLS